jgi:hypothetical protein
MNLQGGGFGDPILMDEDRYLFLNFARFFDENECTAAIERLDAQLVYTIGKVARKLAWLKHVLRFNHRPADTG